MADNKNCPKCGSLLPGNAPSGHFRNGQGLVGAVTLTAIHFVLVALILVALLKIVPSFARVFEEFDLDLPAISVSVLRLSAMVASYWYIAVPLAFICLAIDLIVLRLLGRASRVLQSLVGIGLVLAALAIGTIISLGMWVPFAKMMDALS